MGPVLLIMSLVVPLHGCHLFEKLGAQGTFHSSHICFVLDVPDELLLGDEAPAAVRTLPWPHIKVGHHVH